MLYTRKGDKGDTYFFGSKKRASKASCQTEALGALDELNSYLGICRAKARKENIEIAGQHLYKIIETAQQNLFIIQAAIAGADKNISENKIKEIENIVDSIESKLPPIKTFFLAGATELSAYIDFGRTLARRTERAVVRQSEEGDSVSPEILQYLNRLSSLLYALVRIINKELDATEIPPTYE